MKLRFLPILFAMVAIFVGCEKDDDSPTNPGTYTPSDSTWSDGSGGYNVRLNATSSSAYRYYDLSNRSVVEITDWQSSTNMVWDLAFRRFMGKTNGGASGGAGMKAVDMASLNFADSTNFDAVASVPAIADSLWMEDRMTLAIPDADWWWYTGPPNHWILPTKTTFMIKTAIGKFGKVSIDSLALSTMSRAGMVTLKFVYQTDGSTNIGGAAQFATIDATTGPAYFSFSTGGSVAIATPSNSTAWDLMIDGYSIKLNSSLSGPGMAGAIKSDTTFDATVTVPAGQPFNQDGSISVFGTDSVMPWFNYLELNRTLLTKNHVYLLRTSANVTYKMQITNYYMVVGGTSQSGWMQFRFKQL